MPRVCNAERYERSEARRDTRAGRRSSRLCYQRGWLRHPDRLRRPTRVSAIPNGSLNAHFLALVMEGTNPTLFLARPHERTPLVRHVVAVPFECIEDAGQDELRAMVEECAVHELPADPRPPVVRLDLNHIRVWVAIVVSVRLALAYLLVVVIGLHDCRRTFVDLNNNRPTLAVGEFEREIVVG